MSVKETMLNSMMLVTLVRYKEEDVKGQGLSAMIQEVQRRS